MRNYLFMFGLVLASACGGSASSPSPSGPVMALSGSMNFPAVVAGTTSTATLTIANQGSSKLHVLGIATPRGFGASPSTATIAAGTSQDVTITFQPDTAGFYGGTLKVAGNEADGSSTVSIFGSAVSNVTGRWTGTLDLNFIDLSNTCTDSWIIGPQSVSQFSGTTQEGGGDTFVCVSGGTFTGTIDPNGAVTNLTFSTILGSPDPKCSVVTSLVLSGVVLDSVGALRGTDAISCPSIGTVTRSVTVNLRRVTKSGALP